MISRQYPAGGIVVITRSAYERLIAACRRLYPFEACGVLAASGTERTGGAPHLSIDAVHPVKNAAVQPADSFAFDPQDWVRAYADMRRSRQSIAGFYHSHPHAAPLPSVSDLSGWRQFGGESLTYWIVSFSSGEDRPPELAAYRMARREPGEDGLSMLTQIRIEIA